MGSLHAVGGNAIGQLGLGDTVDRSTFEQVGISVSWDAAAAGHYSGFSFAIKSDGELWAVGANDKGQLGLGDTVTRTAFTQVGSGVTWQAVACGPKYAIALKTDGTLWSTGYNVWGSLGQGDTVDLDVFTQIGVGTTWASIACGNFTTFAIQTDGTLWACGRNVEYQLGTGSWSSPNSFTQSGIATDWAEIASGDFHSIGIKTGGTLWGVGLDGVGAIGLGGGGTTYQNWTQIGISASWSKVSCNTEASVGVMSDGTLWATGYNGYGQLGFGDIVDRVGFTQVGADTLWSGVKCGPTDTFATKINSTLWSVGRNDDGALGVGDTIEHHSFTQVLGITEEATAMAIGGSYSFLVIPYSSLGNHRGIAGIDGGVIFNGKTVIGDRSNGKIYALDMDSYLNNGEPITRIRRTQIISKQRVNVLHHQLEIEFEPGVGLDGEDPQAILQWSDDGGNTWSDERSVDIGEDAEYGTRAIWRQLGRSRNRIYQLTINDPVKVVLIGADARLQACRV
jgi:alpha-tubulin suppressor-like RCC1 family protein